MRDLKSLAAEFDKSSDINRLPRRTLLQALAHPEHVAVVSLVDPGLELLGMDQEEGYTLLDNEYQDLYTKTDLARAAWGQEPEDQAWLLSTEFGDWAYLAYTELDGTERVVMLIHG